MSVFASGERGAESSKHSGRDAGLSIIAHGMRVIGELVTEGVLKIEGTVEGTVRTELVTEGVLKIEGTVEGTVRTTRDVLVAKGGKVEGDIHAGEAVIGGEVHGSIYAEARVEVHQGAVVEGDISTKKLVVQEGGDVNGQIRMGQARPPATATASDSQVASMAKRSTGPIVRA
jgi:cytoskeletal protein CcmA (bactofilin family)